MATTKEKFEALPAEIVTNFRLKGIADGIPETVQRFILAIDKVPEQLRRSPNISKCARELMVKYPAEFTEFKTTQNLIYAAIEYFNLNSSVTNAAWDNYYADKQEELAQIAAAGKRPEVASLCLDRARTYRQANNESGVDKKHLKPVTVVVSPMVTPRLLGLPDDADLTTVFKHKTQLLNDANSFIDGLDLRESQKAEIKKEAALNLNESYTDYEPID